MIEHKKMDLIGGNRTQAQTSKAEQSAKEIDFIVQNEPVPVHVLVMPSSRTPSFEVEAYRQMTSREFRRWAQRRLRKQKMEATK